MGLPPRVKPELELIFASPDDSASVPAALVAAAGPLAEEGAGALLWLSLLAGWLEQLAPELPPERRAPRYSLGLRLTDDAGIALLNRTWRGMEGPTDVLAFAALDEAAWDGEGPLPPMPLPPGLGGEGEEEGDCGEPLELGDIVISLETAGRQAREAGVTLERELRFLASHGLLHLLGWDHPDEASLAAMLERQERLLG